jgi:competence protein ComEC
LPLISAAYLLYVAGLLAGYEGAGWLAIGSGLLCSLFLLLRRQSDRAALTILFAAAVIIALSSPLPVRSRDALRAKPPPGALERFRHRAAESIDSVFVEDAPLARALLIADQHQIPVEMRDRYAAAGIIHMLSISGLHVAVIAAAMELLFQVLRFPRRTAVLAAFIATAVYVAVIGAPPAALRSAAMLAVTMVSRMLQRPTSPWAAWALGSFVPLYDPRIVLDVGYQLSVLGMASLVAAGKLWRLHLASRMPDDWRGKLAHELITSLVACAITAPLVAWVFGRISLVAPLSNLAAAPVIGIAQPILFLALVLAPLHDVARFVAQAAHPLLVLFDAIARLASSLPGASLVVATTWAAACLGGIAAACLIRACITNHPSRPAIGALASLAIMAVTPNLALGVSHDAEMHFLDVGQGDAILLRTPKGRWILFDAGPSWNGSDAGRSVILPYVLRRGGSLEGFVLSHPHTDHVGGAAAVLTSLHPRNYWDAAFAGGSEAYNASLQAARSSGVQWHRVHPGDSVLVDGVRLLFLAPDSVWTTNLKDPNLASTVVSVSYGAVRFLLVGDAERAEEDWLLAKGGEGLRADVLKVGHHGSSTSSSDAFLAAVQPRLAVISVGALNKYGHPSIDVIAALKRVGADVLRTDDAGTIIVRTNGSTLEVEDSEEKWELSRDSPPP